MAKGIEFLLGGAICLIIAIIHSVMEKKISPAGILAIGLFIYGVYRVAIAKNQIWFNVKIQISLLCDPS